MGNKFSNATDVVLNDMHSFLCSLNWQTFNKQKMYHGANEINSIRIGYKTFEWHQGDEAAYTMAIPVEKQAAYYFAYDVNEDLTITYYYDEAQAPENPYYSYSYIDVYTEYDYEDYLYGTDNYYAYIRKQYVPIEATLAEEINNDLTEFGNAHGGVEDNYTYYMSECQVSIPMTLNSFSIGTKQSTFIVNFTSNYDGWFYDTIGFNAAIDTEGLHKKVATITSSYDSTVFSMRKDENVHLGADVTIDKGQTKSMFFKGSLSEEDPLTLTTPYKMRELSLAPMAEYLTGTLDLTSTGWTSKGNDLKSVVFGSSTAECALTKISGMNDLVNLEYVGLRNLASLASTPAIYNLSYLHVFDAQGSNITAFKPKENTTIYEAWLPDTVKAIKLKSVNFEENDMTVLNENMHFFGRLNYEPSRNLQSFTCTSTTGIDTYEFVKNWIEALGDELAPEKLIYLELDSIDWDNVPVDMMYKLKKFDLDVNNETPRKGLVGQITVKGTGNYGLLTIEEYSQLLRMYGRDAMNLTGSFKVFPELQIIPKGNAIEPYEFYLTVTNENLSSEDPLYAELDAELIYSNIATARPTASISFIDILKENSRTLTFSIDKYEKYAYCKLPKSIDTTDATETTAVSGDIMLFNGDTILVFFGIPTNSYKYVKLGHIDDLTVKNQYGEDQNLLGDVWMNAETITLKFAAISKPSTVNSIELTQEDGKTFIMPDSDFDEDHTLEITRTINGGDYHGDLDSIALTTTPEDAEFTVTESGSTLLINVADSDYEETEASITVTSTYTDDMASSIGIDAKYLVNDSFEFNILNKSTVDEDGVATLNPYLYDIKNGILIIKDPNAVKIEETENETTIILK